MAATTHVTERDTRAEPAAPSSPAPSDDGLVQASMAIPVLLVELAWLVLLVVFARYLVHLL